MSKVFVSTDARRPYPRGVIGSTVGAYPRGTGSNPVEGNGHFFPSYRQLYLRLSLTHPHTVTCLALVGSFSFCSVRMAVID